MDRNADGPAPESPGNASLDCMAIDGAKSLVLTGLESSPGESSVINSSEALEMTQTSADSVMEKIIAEIKGTMEITTHYLIIIFGLEI